MSRKRKHILWTTLIVAGLVSIAAGAVSRRASLLRGDTAVSTAPEADRAQPPIAARKKEMLGYELVTLTRFGFEPAEITRRDGHFFLAIENRSAARNLTIRIDPERGNRVREITQETDELNWVDELKLPPGRYQISTADQPDRVCRLTITP